MQEGNGESTQKGLLRLDEGRFSVFDREGPYREADDCLHEHLYAPGSVDRIHGCAQAEAHQTASLSPPPQCVPDEEEHHRVRIRAVNAEPTEDEPLEQKNPGGRQDQTWKTGHAKVGR